MPAATPPTAVVIEPVTARPVRPQRNDSFLRPLDCPHGGVRALRVSEEQLWAYLGVTRRVILTISDAFDI